MGPLAGVGQNLFLFRVSIQLIAPASGARVIMGYAKDEAVEASFHSTDCPSEWGLVDDPTFEAITDG